MRASTLFWAILHSKCPPIMKKCVPGDNKELLDWENLKFYKIFGERVKKPNRPFRIYRGLIENLNFEQGLLCKCVQDHVKHVYKPIKHD
jgi:hypothetical protein